MNDKKYHTTSAVDDAMQCAEVDYPDKDVSDHLWDTYLENTGSVLLMSIETSNIVSSHIGRWTSSFLPEIAELCTTEDT